MGEGAGVIGIVDAHDFHLSFPTPRIMKAPLSPKNLEEKHEEQIAPQLGHPCATY